MRVIRIGGVIAIATAISLTGCSDPEQPEGPSAPAFSVFETPGEDESDGEDSQATARKRPLPTEREEIGVQNRAPMVRSLGIERLAQDEGPDAGMEYWRAVASTSDADGDSVTVEYEWLVNGVPTEGEHDLFPVMRLAQGDQLQVVVQAYDGEVSSPKVRSGSVEVGNTPPAIVSRPPRPDANGFFRYQVEVEDADGDGEFRFELRTAPEGMKLNEESGLVTWRPNPDQAGRHDVEVVVQDDGGAEAFQAFSIALITETDDSVPAAMP